MSNQGNTNENIQLSLPINAAYVSAARLTASSIANRMRFDVDEVEDVKAAVSEACTFIIKNFGQDSKSEYTLKFTVDPPTLNITIEAKSFINIEKIDSEMGITMLRALMDTFHMENMEDGFFKIIMSKKHNEITFKL